MFMKTTQRATSKTNTGSWGDWMNPVSLINVPNCNLKEHIHFQNKKPKDHYILNIHRVWGGGVSKDKHLVFNKLLHIWYLKALKDSLEVAPYFLPVCLLNTVS